MGHDDRPSGDDVIAFPIRDEACGLDAVEGQDVDVVMADDDEGAAGEIGGVGEWIRPPQIVLTMSVAKGQTHGIDERLPIAIEPKLAGQVPGAAREDGLDALAAQFGADAVDLGGEEAPAA